MGDVLDLHASIGKGGRDAGFGDQVGIIWKRISLAKHISKQVSKVELQEKEEMEKVKTRDLK